MSKPADEFPLADAGSRAHLDARRLVVPGREVFLGIGQGHAGEGHLGHAVAAAEGRQAHDRHVDGVGRTQDGCVADLQIAPLRGAPVDDDLAGPLGGASLGQSVRVELGVVDPVARRGSAGPGPDGLAVGAGQLVGALDVGHGGRDTRDLFYGPHETGSDRLAHPLALSRRGDGSGAADHRIRAAGRFAEHGVEAGAQCVAHDEGPGEEGHAEEDREEGPGEAPLVGTQGGDAEAYGGVHEDPSVPVRARDPARAGVSRAFIRSRTLSAVGDSIRSTRRPSARKTTSSAWAAATGSWVTMTTVRAVWRTVLPSRPRTSPPERESRFPVGSSAKTTSSRSRRTRGPRRRVAAVRRRVRQAGGGAGRAGRRRRRARRSTPDRPRRPRDRAAA